MSTTSDSASQQRSFKQTHNKTYIFYIKTRVDHNATLYEATVNRQTDRQTDRQSNVNKPISESLSFLTSLMAHTIWPAAFFVTPCTAVESLNLMPVRDNQRMSIDLEILSSS